MFRPQPQGRNSSTRQVSVSLALQHTTLFLPLISTQVLIPTHSETQQQPVLQPESGAKWVCHWNTGRGVCLELKKKRTLNCDTKDTQ